LGGIEGGRGDDEAKIGAEEGDVLAEGGGDRERSICIIYVS